MRPSGCTATAKPSSSPVESASVTEPPLPNVGSKSPGRPHATDASTSNTSGPRERIRARAYLPDRSPVKKKNRGPALQQAAQNEQLPEGPDEEDRRAQVRDTGDVDGRMADARPEEERRPEGGARVRPPGHLRGEDEDRERRQVLDQIHVRPLGAARPVGHRQLGAAVAEAPREAARHLAATDEIRDRQRNAEQRGPDEHREVRGHESPPFVDSAQLPARLALLAKRRESLRRILGHEDA